ncbi:hypothetical protein BH10ACI1_BH10ACI1_01460 [soil metagenome]
MISAKIFIVLTFLLAFAVCVSAQSVQFPNELKGYEFFGNGKLKDFKIGSSKKKDVEITFGTSCEKVCDYDENFTIKFEYLKPLDDCMTTEDIRDRAMCPQNEFVGTISSITIEPKQTQILKDLPTSKFNKVSGGSTTEKGSGISSSYTEFTDKYGLRYSLDNESDGKITVYSQYPQFIQGKLYSIKYIFTDDFIRKVFTVEYMTRKKELKQ